MILDIQQLIGFDQELLLKLNGSDSLFWDGFMWIVTDTKTWIFVGAVLLYVIFKNNKLMQGLTILLMIALVITLSDQFASTVCKPFFMRFRPTQDPELMYLVQTVNGYRGGMYGFMSSHAANTFSAAMLLALLLRDKWFTVMVFIWAAIPSYSRMYLGVHYPGDIFCGALSGCLIACLVYWLYTKIQKKFFDQGKFISTQYTSSGFETEDVRLVSTALLITYLYAVVAGMVVSKSLYF
ncbi:phosphatase PAP2 family protein [uncultured Bacteroides sp.]|uniref:phosphatase PAP2 family protein n=1 Tax=uncultured Bacteroides sp. TaxID=162156 RepID=UPI0026326860|nr:phosphatase PAP2 family protein [uncultured Bacteroides sp.]